MVTKTCRWCGNEFTTKNNASQFCSAECRRRYHVARTQRFFASEPYTIKCAWCGEIFSAERKRKYCCSLCQLRATGKINGIAKRKTDKPVKSIEEVAKICGELKISYGEYMTRYKGDE